MVNDGKWMVCHWLMVVGDGKLMVVGDGKLVMLTSWLIDG